MHSFSVCAYAAQTLSSHILFTVINTHIECPVLKIIFCVLESLLPHKLLLFQKQLSVFLGKNLPSSFS